MQLIAIYITAHTLGIAFICPLKLSCTQQFQAWFMEMCTYRLYKDNIHIHNVYYVKHPKLIVHVIALIQVLIYCNLLCMYSICVCLFQQGYDSCWRE